MKKPTIGTIKIDGIATTTVMKRGLDELPCLHPHEISIAYEGMIDVLIDVITECDDDGKISIATRENAEQYLIKAGCTE